MTTASARRTRRCGGLPRPPEIKRGILPAHKTLVDSVLGHAEETLFVSCHYPAASKECGAVLEGGVADTFIGLPAHVGEGLFARIVSVDPAGADP